MSSGIKYKIHISRGGGRWGWKAYMSPFDPNRLPIASGFGAHNREAARKDSVKWILGSGISKECFDFIPEEEEEDLFPSFREDVEPERRFR